MPRALYTLALWFVPGRVWAWYFDAEWLWMPSWAPPYVMALLLGKRWDQFNRVDK